MIIDRLILRNFKRFRDEEIHFKDGITGILGNNGTGKSSLVEAIFFALFGTERSGGLQSEYIVSSFASSKEKCEVRLDFRIGGISYSVLRTFKKDKIHDVQLNIGEGAEKKLLAKTVTDVDIQIRRILGMGRLDFKNTIYAAQKDLLNLLEADPAKRREWFLRALGIEYLNTESQKILKERVDTKTADLQLLEGECKALIERQTAQDEHSLLESVASSRQAIAHLQKQQEDQEGQKSRIEADLRLFSDQKTEYTRLTERYQALIRETEGLIRQRDLVKTKLFDLVRQEQEYRGLEPRVASYADKKQAFETLRNCKSVFDLLNAELLVAQRDCNDLVDRMNRTREKLTVLDNEAARRQSLITGIRHAFSLAPGIPDTEIEPVIASREAEIQHTLGTLSSRQNQLAAEQKKLLADHDTIKNAGAEGVCPLCHQKLGAHYLSIEQEFTSRLEQIQDEAVKVCGLQEHTTAEKQRIHAQKPDLASIRSLTVKLTQREPVEAELADLQVQLRSKELAYPTLEQKKKELGFDEGVYLRAQTEVSELEKLHARYNDLREKLAQGTVFKKQMSDLEEQIARKQEESARLKSDIDRSSFDSEKGEAIGLARKEIDAAISSTVTEIARTTEHLRHTEEKIVDCKKTKTQIADISLRVLSITEEIELLKLTRTIIADYVVYLMQVVKSRIQSEVSHIISEITGGRYEQVLLDEDFNLRVRDIDNDYSIDRFSGGEQDDIAVALRIALSRYLAELHQVHESTFLIFDEIFGSQDEERRSNLLTALRTQESRFPQILLISHIAEMQGEFANTLVIEMGADGSSRVKEVE